MRMNHFACLMGMATLAIVPAAFADDAPHAANMAEMPEESAAPSADAAERTQLEAKGLLFPLKNAEKSAAPNLKEGGIVFGYAQSYGSSGSHTDFYRWEALSHVASTFVSFSNDGTISAANENTWINRDSNLKAGGAAEAAGVKVILTILNSGFDVDVINDVMDDSGNGSAAKRQTLVDEIVTLLKNDDYNHGVTFDFEPFSWSSGATTGMVDFFSRLRTSLDAEGLTSHEISIYSDPTPGTNQWANPGISPYLDYMLYSGYDYASGLTPHAITDHNSTIGNMDFYFERGLEPEKFVYVISSYSRRWANTTAYNSAGTSSSSMGFTDALYDVTLNPTNGGPHTENYVTGDEVSWYTYNSSGTDYTVTFDSPRALTHKVGSSLSYPGSGDYQGRKMAGVGFWSLMWMNETTSYDPIASASANKTRTYPQIYQLCQEILAPAGQEDFVAVGFEGLNFRWRDPNEGPDDSGDSDNNSVRNIVTAPAGAGRPASTNNAMQLSFDMESGGKLFFRHELLASNTATSVMDTNAVAAQFDSTTELEAYIHTSLAYANATVRMVVMDANRELEMSPAFSLNATGWRTITWDLTNPATAFAYNTSEPAFLDGDGAIDSANDGSRDLAFVGFLLENSSSVNGSVIFDEVTYRHVNAGGLDYKINEVRYDSSTGEYVEIYGPAGSLPAGFQLRAIDGESGTITTFNVSGTVPNDGGGFGYFVVGDSNVPNVDFSTGFSTGVDDLPDGDPSAIQLINTTNTGVYDSFVYEAFAGLDELVSQEMLGVANEGFPWFGRSANGTDPAGTKHAAGRYPDGTDTNINNADFSLMKATPGAPNGTGLTASSITTWDFSSTPAHAFSTFQSIVTTASGVGASPSGGNVLRCVDTAGGGVLNYFGDAGLGSDGNGYQVAGEIFLPASGAPAQAVAVGICGGQGSTFFSSFRDSSSYENGYWLIYENNSSADLDDGLASHPGVVHFVMASHDNQDAAPVVSLGSLNVSGLSGGWTDFDISIDPVGNALVATVGGNTIYSGTIPSGGRTSGPVMIGFREFDSTVSSVEGTWIDNLRVGPVGTVPVEVDAWVVD
ncbi:MAG: hypothetical protein PWP23_906 [Candidatus Sumerlaeota bacterium]|nr:hypothetical protein [Candidatus Sumerlaeota bacterium]